MIMITWLLHAALVRLHTLLLKNSKFHFILSSGQDENAGHMQDFHDQKVLDRKAVSYLH